MPNLFDGARRDSCAGSSRRKDVFQSITPLTMGEFWVRPAALKLALVEHLRMRGAASGGERAFKGEQYTRRSILMPSRCSMTAGPATL
jgi:hypothetical protein